MSFISYLINGISLGSVYAIIALGYTMVYGIAKMLNFAHGDVIMIGAYVVMAAVTGAGLPPAADNGGSQAPAARGAASAGVGAESGHSVCPGDGFSRAHPGPAAQGPH